VRHQKVDPVSEPVQAGAGPADLVRACHQGPGRPVADGQPVGRQGERGQRPHQGTGQLVGDHHAEQQQERADAEQEYPGPGDAVTQHRVGDEGADHRGPAG